MSELERKKQRKTSPFDLALINLPKEILLSIFTWLQPKDIVLSVARTCKAFLELSRSENLWTILFDNLFGEETQFNDILHGKEHLSKYKQFKCVYPEYLKTICRTDPPLDEQVTSLIEEKDFATPSEFIEYFKELTAIGDKYIQMQNYRAAYSHFAKVNKYIVDSQEKLKAMHCLPFERIPQQSGIYMMISNIRIAFALRRMRYNLLAIEFYQMAIDLERQSRANFPEDRVQIAGLALPAYINLGVALYLCRQYDKVTECYNYAQELWMILLMHWTSTHHWDNYLMHEALEFACNCVLVQRKLKNWKEVAKEVHLLLSWTSSFSDILPQHCDYFEGVFEGFLENQVKTWTPSDVRLFRESWKQHLEAIKDDVPNSPNFERLYTSLEDQFDEIIKTDK